MFSAARRRRLVTSTFSLIELFFFRPKGCIGNTAMHSSSRRRSFGSNTACTRSWCGGCATNFARNRSVAGSTSPRRRARGSTDAEKGFRLLGRIPGVIGCVDGTMVSIVGPSKNDPTVTKAAYWCRKYFYALNVMVVCDADCRIMCIDPRYPESVHDSFVWQFSWLRNQLEQGQLPRDGRFLLGDSLGSSPLSPGTTRPPPLAAGLIRRIPRSGLLWSAASGC
ncbi:putative nuclease HARBI1 isoform X2 [Ixodes scapularis]